jgi:hypothetical protein
MTAELSTLKTESSAAVRSRNQRRRPLRTVRAALYPDQLDVLRGIDTDVRRTRERVSYYEDDGNLESASKAELARRDVVFEHAWTAWQQHDDSAALLCFAVHRGGRRGSRGEPG